MTNRWIIPGIWLLVSLLAAVAHSVQLPSATIHGEYIPVGNDSFYHARRILDTVRDPDAFYQFDSKIHAPEGSLLVWPWGYDYLLAGIVRLGMAAGISAEPMAILIWLPVAALFLSLGLTIVIARQLSLSSPLVALAALCMACAPSTRLLHGVGEIDHHFAELIFVLGSLAAGLAWLQRPTLARAIVLGVTLGVAPAIHNGLFILQIPVLSTLFIRWLQGVSSPPRTVLAFAIALVIATLAALIPSQAFQSGRFEFYTLSWFHLYIAGSSALLAVFLTRTTRTRNSSLWLVAIAAALLVGILSQLDLAAGFLGGTLGRLKTIQEMRSPVALALAAPGFVTRFYSLLIWLAPITFGLCVLLCWRRRKSPELLFWVSCVWGLALLSAQLRLHYFGAFALYLPWLVLIQELARKRPEFEKRILLGACLALLLAYVPQLRYELLHAPPKAADIWYERVEPLLQVLRKACADDPGIVLADNNAGHYIRYSTDCSVIANNFLLTPQHFQKLDEADRLFSLSPPELLRAPPHPKYVLVRPVGIARSQSGEYRYTFSGAGPQRLARELLFAPAGALPPQYRLLGVIPLPRVTGVAYAKLYKIDGGLAAAE